MIPKALPSPGERVEFDTDHGEYSIVGDTETVWFIVGVHGTELLNAFAAELRLEMDGYILQEGKPELIVRFEGEPDWRAPLMALFESELASERERLCHPDE